MDDPMEGSSIKGKPDIMKHISFSVITQLLTKIKNSTGNNNKSEIVKNYFASYRKFESDFKTKNPNATCSIFPILRLMIPKSDRERDAYGIKHTLMGRLYVKALGLYDQSEDAKMINMKLGYISGCSDYADVVFKVIQNRCKQKSDLTVYDVNRYLDDISQLSGTGNNQEIENIFVDIIRTGSAEDQKWIIRLILKSLRLGIAEKAVLDQLHPKANILYGQLSSLSRVCSAIESDNLEVSDVVSLNVPLRSMLCESLNLSRIEGLLKQSDFYVELKMDGERMQIHKEGIDFRFFSRNSDSTDIFSGDDKNEKFKRNLQRHIKASSVILDGEIMVWDKNTENFLDKGENYDVKYLRKFSHLEPSFCAFDILFLNGKSLIMKPYQERVRLLDSILVPKLGLLTINQRTKVTTSKEILDYFNKAIDNNEEGIVVKDQDSIYCPGIRNKSGWYKIKPDYIDGLVEDLDLLIIGAFLNKFGKVESFLLGVSVSEEKDLNKMKFYSVGTVRTGLNREQWSNLNKSLEPHWKKITKPKTRNAKIEEPSWVEWGKSVPDAFIDPKESIILEVRASELTKTYSFRTDFTLRFPRIKTIRSDKPWHDCCTLKEFETIAKGETKIVKLAKRHADQSDLGSNNVKRLRSSKNKLNLPLVQEETKELPKIDDVLKEKEFCVLSSLKKGMKIQEIESIITRHGGIIVKNPGPTTFAIIAGDFIAMVKKYIATNSYNIVKVDWVTRTLNEEKLDKFPKWRPTEMITVTEKTKEQLQQDFDEFNDSYTDLIENDEELRMILESFELQDYEKLLKREISALEDEIFEEGENFNFFSKILAYFDVNEKLLDLVFQSRRGVVVSDISLATHVIVDDKLSDHLIVPENCNVVSSNWILESNKRGRLLNEADYLIV